MICVIHMQEFDCIVIGSGSGLNVASGFARHGKEVAVVEPGPLGGTCLNRGCIPSKMLIAHADIADAVYRSEQFHIDASVDGVDFASIVQEVNETVQEDADSIKRGIEDSDNHTLFREEARFVDEKVLAVGDEKITAPKIVVAAGSRPMVPPIDGLEDVEYMTSRDALKLEDQPDELVVIGGGYIACELSYFYGAMGTDVTIIEMGDSLLGREDMEVSEFFTQQFVEDHDVYLGMRASAVEQDGDRITVTAEDEDGNTEEVTGDALLVAAGRVPNTDRLEVEEAGLETDDRGFLETDAQLGTSVDGVWALGDIAGNWMFKHSANEESAVVFRNAFLDAGRELDDSAMPHAVFSSPEVAGAGATEQELEDAGREYRSATYEYARTGKGMALKEDGFAKVLIDPDDRSILGFHIVGPDASQLIHEVLVAMRAGAGTIGDITDTIHIHPALNEVVQRACEQL